MPKDHLQKSDICVIVLRDVLIGMDISTTIAEARPGTQVLWVKTPDEIMTNLSADLCIAVVFIDMAREAFVKSALATRLALDEGLLVLVGQDSIQETVGQLRDRSRVLAYPFSMDDVLDVMPEPK